MESLPTHVLSQYIAEILEESPSKFGKPEDYEDVFLQPEPIMLQQPEPRSRGRPRIPLRWTRMISVYGDDHSETKCFELATDLLVDNAMDKAPAKKRGETEWKPLFWPKEYTQTEHDHSLEGNKITDTKLRMYGKAVTNMRNQLRLRAKALPIIPEEMSGSRNMEQYVKKLAVKIHKGYFKPYKESQALAEQTEDTPIPMRRVKWPRSTLSKQEMLGVVHAVLVEHKPVSEVAKQYRVFRSHVNTLVSKSRKKPKFIAELFSHPNMESLKYSIIEKVVTKLFEENAFVDSCQQVLEIVYESDERAKMLVNKGRQSKYLVQKSDVNKVMKQMGLSYRKVIHIANTANSISSKLLRQQWAINFIKNITKDKVFLNLDETWLGMSDFRR